MSRIIHAAASRPAYGDKPPNMWRHAAQPMQTTMRRRSAQHAAASRPTCGGTPPNPRTQPYGGDPPSFGGKPPYSCIRSQHTAASRPPHAAARRTTCGGKPHRSAHSAACRPRANSGCTIMYEHVFLFVIQAVNCRDSQHYTRRGNSSTCMRRHRQQPSPV